MEYRILGSTGLKVSILSLGTVSLGVDYGIEAPEEFGRPTEADAIWLLQKAADAGINLFDTAPGYGESERLLGKALGARQECLFATKVSIPKSASGQSRCDRMEISRAINKSLENSLRVLGREVLDIVQIHNATVGMIQEGDVVRALLEAREAGMIRLIGASVYTEAEALAVVESGWFDVLQVAYSVLDRRMEESLLPKAKEMGVGILTRSALLKGALTYKAQWLPEGLRDLKDQVFRINERMADGSWDQVQETAIRFCLSSPDVGSVLIGPRTSQELRFALEAEQKGPLPEPLSEMLGAFQLHEERLLNPSFWPVA